MITPRYTTVDRILEKVRNEGFEEVYRDDIMEWMWDVVGYLGIVQALQDKVVEVEFDNYRFNSPNDLYEINGIREKVTQCGLRRSTDLFHTLNHVDNIAEPTRFDGITVNVTPTGTGESTAFITAPNQPLNMTQMIYLERDLLIYLGFKQGTIQMSYKAFPVDDAGFPMIPDDAKYIRAVVDYICMKIAKRLMLRDQLSERKYIILETNYYFSAGAARTKAHIPDMDLMEAIKNRSLRLIPTITEHRSSFRFTGESERLNRM